MTNDQRQQRDDQQGLRKLWGSVLIAIGGAGYAYCIVFEKPIASEPLLIVFGAGLALLGVSFVIPKLGK